jgi:elongation factor 1-alpha
MVPQKPLCVENFADFPALGRFVVREGKNSVAIGIIKKVNYK